jgi:transcriptional regulator with XRE-family HTH domain
LAKKTPAVDLMVAQRVAELRLAAKLTEAELASLAQLHVSKVEALERGERQPMETLSAVAVALNVPVTAFFEGDVVANVSQLKATLH